MAKASKEIIQKHEQMFYPTVRVRTKKAGGSGTVVYSKEYKDGWSLAKDTTERNLQIVEGV